MKKLKAIMFWLLSLTWGLPMTLVGIVCAMALLVTGHKPKRFHYLIYFEAGQGWGGFNAGCFFFVNKGAYLRLKQHESGHGIQNIIFGVFMPFIVAIPSFIRYWYREYLVRSGKKSSAELTPYDSVWFEGWASSLGEKHYPQQ